MTAQVTKISPAALGIPISRGLSAALTVVRRGCSNHDAL
jgi:hypothetical protein